MSKEKEIFYKKVRCALLFLEPVNGVVMADDAIKIAKVREL